MQEAINKLQEEIRNSNNAYVKVIGEFLISHINAFPAAADKVMATDKTILNSLDAMKQEAQKIQHNGMAMLTDAEGFTIVLKYFGIEEQSAVFDVKLDDLLGGL
ncbi:hypothetical protein D3C87_993920 [compost metagenome]